MNEQRGDNGQEEAIAERESAETSRIHLWFGRHDVKRSEKAQQAVLAERGGSLSLDDITDEMIELTPEGALRAQEQAEADTLQQGVAFGSPKRRSQQEALLKLGGKEVALTGKESPEELERLINEAGGLKAGAKGSKLGSDPRLDFILADTPYAKQVNAAYKDGHLLEYLVEKSDMDAELLGDKASFTYRSAARSIADLILKYLDIAPRWDALVREKPTQYTSRLERAFGSHNGIIDAFLARLIQETHGKQERNRFVRATGRKGFNFSEGFDLDIVNHGQNKPPTIRFRFFKPEDERGPAYSFVEDVDKATLDAIVEKTPGHGTFKESIDG